MRRPSVFFKILPTRLKFSPTWSRNFFKTCLLRTWNLFDVITVRRNYKHFQVLTFVEVQFFIKLFVLVRVEFLRHGIGASRGCNFLESARLDYEISLELVQGDREISSVFILLFCGPEIFSTRYQNLSFAAKQFFQN